MCSKHRRLSLRNQYERITSMNMCTSKSIHFPQWKEVSTTFYFPPRSSFLAELQRATSSAISEHIVAFLGAEQRETVALFEKLRIFQVSSHERGSLHRQGVVTPSTSFPAMKPPSQHFPRKTSAQSYTIIIPLHFCPRICVYMCIIAEEY